MQKGFRNPAYRIYWLLLLVFVINCLQAAFTELSDDEAYYWMYAQHLDVGYFDHPATPVTLEAIFLHFKTLKEITPAQFVTFPKVLAARETITCQVEVQLPSTSDTYNMGICIKAGIVGPLFNSNMTLITTQ